MKEKPRERYAVPVVYLGQLAGLSPSASPNSGTSHSLSADDLDYIRRESIRDDAKRDAP